MKRIITVPHETLRKKSAPVDLEGGWEKAEKVIRDLQSGLKKGVGLSAPQIGSNIRIISSLLAPSVNALNSDRESNKNGGDLVARIYINPEILETSNTVTFGPDPKDPILEGCLSIPNLFGPVPRYDWIRMRYLTETKEQKEEQFFGFFARVLQHEFDHLDGILFTDYILKYDLPLFEHRKKTLVEIDSSIARVF